MRHNISIESERVHLIELLQKAELDRSMVRRMKKMLEPKDIEIPGHYTIDEMREILCEQRERGADGIPHCEAMKQFAQWKK